MYGEPRHTVREYVQNAFDAICVARGNGTLQAHEGTVFITIDDSRRIISVKDDGVGIRSSSAWGTLSSVGASTKDRNEQAGFRGIGRLAGLAYCEKLHFITKHRSDPVESTITFDCNRLRRGMDPTQDGGEDIQTLLTDAISDSYREVEEGEVNGHYTEVMLENTKLAPPEITSVTALAGYLSQTAPIDFHPTLWSYSEKIKKFAVSQGEQINTIRIVMRHVAAAPEDDPILEEADVVEPNMAEFEIFKPYRNAHAPKGRSPVSVNDVRFLSDPTGKKKWWGWIGQMPILGTLADEDAAGLRVRMRNIAIDRTDITEQMFSDIRVSYARFNDYYIGEFHVLTNDVIPNARRDGFEENRAWRDVQNEIRPHLKNLTKTTHKESRSRNAKFKELKRTVDAVAETVEKRLTLPAGIDFGNDQALLLHVNEVAGTLALEVAKDLATEDEAKTLRLMQATVNESRRRLERAASVSATGPGVSEGADRSERLLKLVYGVLQEVLEPSLYRETRREIDRRIKDAGL
jgi:molecular chaperone HtpG